MIVVRIPGTHVSESRYAVDVLLRELLGLEFRVEVGGEGYRIEFADGGCIVVEDHFSSSIPSVDSIDALSTDLVESGTCPVIFGRDIVESSPGNITLGIDVFASAFFMLARWEEVGGPRDLHGRFPAAASLAARAGFLMQPVVDAYADLLAQCIKRIAPGVSMGSRIGEVKVTCDVDEPYDRSLRTPARAARRVFGDLVSRRSMGLAAANLRNAVAPARGDYSRDPCNNFNWMMETCERAGRSITFHVLAGGDTALDGVYSLNEPYIQGLLRTFAERGHAIGMHGSYETWHDGARLGRERAALEAACGKEVRANRQHYLRWDAARTPALLEAAGFYTDSTGCYADAAGFRYGTARPFPMWDLESGKPLRLRQQPLIAMECSVIDDQYMGLGRGAEALDLFATLKRRALRYGGDFTLLWHNNRLIDREDRELYRALVDG